MMISDSVSTHVSDFAISAENLLKALNLFRYKNTEQIIHLLLSRYVVANGELDISLTWSATKLAKICNFVFLKLEFSGCFK